MYLPGAFHLGQQTKPGELVETYFSNLIMAYKSVGRLSVGYKIRSSAQFLPRDTISNVTNRHISGMMVINILSTNVDDGIFMSFYPFFLLGNI